MLLTIDIGNTQLTIGAYAGDHPGPRWRLATAAHRSSDEYGLQILGLLAHARVDPNDLHGVCLASVVPPLTSSITRACRDYLGCQPLVVGAGVKTGVKILAQEPRTVGADRIVNACAVKHRYHGPACVVDFGTATTFDAVTADGDYLGGAIAPGLQLGAESLFRNTAKLPKVDIERPPNVIGRNTIEAIQSGLVFGYVALVEGMVARFAGELGPDMQVIATGGLAEIVARETKVIHVVDPWLTLEGLRIIWELNPH
ncbi:MAG: type III pantothenate kinase [Vulcanimicrobiota bacterium]